MIETQAARGFRASVYGLLEAANTPLGRVLNTLLMVLILLNVTAVIFESVAAVQARYSTWFRVFEAFSIVVFTGEYIGRLWVCVEDPRYASPFRGRLRYARTPMALVDLIAIAPFFLGALIDLDTRIVRAVRLFRVFKLARHSTSMDLLLTVVRNEAATVASSLFIMVIIIILAATGMYLIEKDAQPDAFQSIPQSIWWAAVTLTTVGYGDVVPVTVVGKVFGLVVTVAGVGMVALPAGILASGFSQELTKRRARYELEVRESLSEGAITADQRKELRDKAEDLGLSAEEAKLLLRNEATARTGMLCPHCKKPIR